MVMGWNFAKLIWPFDYWGSFGSECTVMDYLFSGGWVR